MCKVVIATGCRHSIGEAFIVYTTVLFTFTLCNWSSSILSFPQNEYFFFCNFAFPPLRLTAADAQRTTCSFSRAGSSSPSRDTLSLAVNNLSVSLTGVKCGYLRLSSWIIQTAEQKPKNEGFGVVCFSAQRLHSAIYWTLGSISSARAFSVFFFSIKLNKITYPNKE